ncbi:MAG: hypothetical protein ACH346_08110 [Chthoniobacterales bacterium]
MPQLTIYLNAETERAITKAAKRDALSLSRWSREKLLIAAGAPAWPSGYADFLGGAHDETFKAPKELNSSDDQIACF